MAVADTKLLCNSHRLVTIQASLLCNFSSVFLIFATQVGHHPSQPALQLPFIATPEGGAGGDRGVRAEPKAPPKIEDSKMCVYEYLQNTVFLNYALFFFGEVGSENCV